MRPRIYFSSSCCTSPSGWRTNRNGSNKIWKLRCSIPFQPATSLLVIVKMSTSNPSQRQPGNKALQGCGPCIGSHTIWPPWLYQENGTNLHCPSLCNCKWSFWSVLYLLTYLRAVYRWKALALPTKWPTLAALWDAERLYFLEKRPSTGRGAGKATERFWDGMVNCLCSNLQFWCSSITWSRDREYLLGGFPVRPVTCHYRKLSISKQFTVFPWFSHLP